MALALKIGLAGVDKVLKAAEKLGDRYERSIQAGLYLFGEEVMTDAKQRVPVDFGTLKGSGYVTLPVEDARTLKVELGFGGPAEAYAIVQHERTEYRHEVGEAKFLENAINAASGSAARRILDIAQKAFIANMGASKGSTPTTPNEAQKGGGKKGEG